MTQMTANQAEAMAILSQYEGKTVEVLTSEYTANVNPEAVRRSVGTFKSAALRGLETKGFIHIEAFYWNRARVTVLARPVA